MTSRGNAARGIVAAVVLGVLMFVVLVQYAPDTVAFSPNNYGWNGIQGVSSTYNVNFTTSLSTVPPRAVLVVIQPSINFSTAESKSVRSFLNGGGTVLVADKSGVANSLLGGIGSGISIESQFSITDQTYNWKSKTVPTALVLPDAQSHFTFLSDVRGIALNQPAPLSTRGTSAIDAAITSQFSSALPLTSSAVGEGPQGPYTVMAAQKIGNGTLIVVGDSQFLLNSEWTIANNKALVGNLFSGTNVYIDASHWGRSSVSQLKSSLGQLYAGLSTSPNRYLFTFASALVVLALLPAADRRKTEVLTPFNDERGGWAR